MIFTPETFDFLSELAVNNNKDWFEANRDRYQTVWLEPAQAFVSEWAAFMAKLQPPHKAEPRVNRSIRRINRDVRFSKDKTPYDPKIHLVFWCGAHPNKSPALHAVLRPNELALGMGQWAMTAKELARYRAEVVDDVQGSRLSALISELKNMGLSLTEETLKRLPADLPPDTGRDTLLKRKGLVLTTGQDPLPLAALDDRDLLERYFRKMATINAWLFQRVYSD